MFCFKEITFKIQIHLLCCCTEITLNYTDFSSILKSIHMVFDLLTCVHGAAVGRMAAWTICRDTPGCRRPDDMTVGQSGRMTPDSSCSALGLHRWIEVERWTQVWRQRCSPFGENYPKESKRNEKCDHSVWHQALDETQGIQLKQHSKIKIY